MTLDVCVTFDDTTGFPTIPVMTCPYFLKVGLDSFDRCTSLGMDHTYRPAESIVVDFDTLTFKTNEIYHQVISLSSTDLLSMAKDSISNSGHRRW